jgi:hypothetical protein
MAVTMARATIAQRTQLVLETTYGAVPATPHWKRLPTLAFKPRPHNEAMSYREQGRKFSSVVIPNKEWSGGTFEGALTYGELPFIYASLFGAISAPTVGTDGEYSWSMQPSNDTPDTPATFSLQHGDNTANGVQAGGMVVVDATLDITRSEAKISGTLLGLPWVTGQTLALTGAPVGAVVSDVENVPITPGVITAYLDSAFGSIGTTKLAKLLSIQHHVTGRWQPEWVIDASQPAYAELVEAAPTSSLTVKMEADAQAMGLFTQYRVGSLAYLRVTTASNGPLIGGTTHYKMQLDVPVEVKELQELSDEGGTYAIAFALEPIADPTATFPMKLLMVNKQSEI